MDYQPYRPYRHDSGRPDEPAPDPSAQPTTQFAALPPAVFNYLLADRFGRDPEKVASIVMAGHFAGVVFLPLALLLALG